MPKPSRQEIKFYRGEPPTDAVDLKYGYVSDGGDVKIPSPSQTWVNPPGRVASVNGQVGDTVITKSDVGLENVDNTADANKPISTATQTALDTKAATSTLSAKVDTTDPRLSDARTPTTHTHPQSEVTDLVTALSGKEPANANIQAHVISAHAPANAQKNSDILKSEIEAVLTGEITSHTHPGGPGGQAFPVGSIFISVVSTNPATLLGYGTWVAFGAGRMLVGIDSGDTDFDTVKETGGAKTITLTEAQIPAHRHALSNLRGATTGSQTTAYGGIAAGSDTTSTLTPYQMATTGGGEAHPNIPPYIVCYFWERTA